MGLPAAPLSSRAGRSPARQVEGASSGTGNAPACTSTHHLRRRHPDSGSHVAHRPMAADAPSIAALQRHLAHTTGAAGIGEGPASAAATAAAPILADQARVLDGRGVAAAWQEELAQAVQDVCARGGRPPGLGVVLVGSRPDSLLYVSRKREACEKVGRGCTCSVRW